MAFTKKEAGSKEVQVLKITYGRITLCILGRTPIILNRIPVKTMNELLMPRKKTAADKAMNLKHNPLEEFRDSPYTNDDDSGPTRLQFLSTAFKSAMRNAAIDIPGSAAKAQIGRLTRIKAPFVDLYGIPMVLTSVIRLGDIARTPDVRTRCIVPEWACALEIEYVAPVLNESAIGNLMAAAGMIQGVGDWRTEKGKASYGSFDVVSKDDPDFVRITKDGGRKAQDLALRDPQPYDKETAELLTWFDLELKRRGREPAEVKVRRNGTKEAVIA